MVKIKSPLRAKELDVNFKGLFGIRGANVDVFDNDRMIIVNLKKGERIAVYDKNDKAWELSRDAKGRINRRRL